MKQPKDEEEESHSLKSEFEGQLEVKGRDHNKQPTFKVIQTKKNINHVETLRNQNTLGAIEEEFNAIQSTPPAEEKPVPATDPKRTETKAEFDDGWNLGLKKKSTKSSGETLVQQETQAFEALLSQIEEENKPSGKRMSSPDKNLDTLEQSRKIQFTQKKGENSHIMELATSPLIKPSVDESAWSSQAPLIAVQKSKIVGSESTQLQYPEGFTAEDDLNKDGKIDRMEYQIKIQTLKENLLHHMDEHVKKEFIKRFRKEVDFHHKVAFRFEKAYRLGRKDHSKMNSLNLEIVEIIQDHSTYLQFDPMALFYCLFFCIYFNNKPLVEFLRSLANKVVQAKPNREQAAAFKRVVQLLEFIDLNGLERLRTSGDNTNQRIYHMVFYQAVDDHLRVVYSKILRKLKAIQMRDKDGKELLITRDYELIRESFSKMTLKLDMQGYFSTAEHSFISRSYRHYNAAYFEEVLLNENVEERMAMNYRERFLVDQHAIYQVLQMYSKMDYLEHFVTVDIDKLAHQQILDLFSISWKYDSMKIALHLYLRYIRSSDITRSMMDKFIESLDFSVRFHEIKLFFILEHFDVMDISQLNQLVDVLQAAYFRPEYKMNPMLHQYNTVKLSLLIYRVSWRIHRKKIYSLITKCQILNKYIIKSLIRYLETFQNVQQLYRFMHEPILDLNMSKDSLDIMLEMDMEEVLNHPVVVEVLNLVYEGQYSVDSQSLYLSQTFQSFFQMETFDMKQVSSRLIANISNFGLTQGEKRQASLQFNIWKYCLEQRLLDEVFFTGITSVILVYCTYRMMSVQKEFLDFMNAVYGSETVTQMHLMYQGGIQIQGLVCRTFQARNDSGVDVFTEMMAIIQIIVLLTMVSVTTSIMQKMLKLRIKQNSELKLDELVLEILIAGTSVAYIVKFNSGYENRIITDLCDEYTNLDPVYKANLQRNVYLIFDIGSFTSFAFTAGANAFLLTAYSVLLLRRTSQFQYIMVMIERMISELALFFSSFGALIFVFFIVLRLIHEDLQHQEKGLYITFKDIFDGFNSILREERFSSSGKAYMTTFYFLARVFYMGFLTTIFVLRYVKVNKSIEADKRKDIIKLKNVISYDPIYGALTMTFYPINIVLLPFIIPLVIMKSERLNDAVLKLQYILLIINYIIIGAASSVIIIPFMYIKIVLNAVYVGINNKRAAYKCQGLVNSLNAIFFGPFIILMSFIVDFLALNVVLMKDEKHFEFKYQQHDPFQGMDKIAITKQFLQMFVINYPKKWKQISMTKDELRKLKTTQFSIVDNFHSFFCRGDKSYVESMANIRVFNLTKALANHAAIPDTQGIRKKDVLEYDVIANIFFDLIMYNFYDHLIINHRVGKYPNHSQLVLYGYPHKGYDQNRHLTCLQWHRKLSETFNYVAVSSIARAFTDVDEVIKQYQEDSDFFNQKRRLLTIEKLQPDWIREVSHEFSSQMSKLDDELNQQEKLRLLNEKKKKKPAKQHSALQYKSGEEDLGWVL